jgi:hypothetical protein
MEGDMKRIFLFLMLVASLTAFSNFNIIEPKVLDNGTGRYINGTNMGFSYGILNLMEIGVTEFVYVKLGSSLGDLKFALGYGQGWNDASIFGGVGLYKEKFKFYSNVFYSEETETIYNWNEEEETSDITYEESNILTPLINFTFFNNDLNGEISLNGQCSFKLQENVEIYGSTSIIVKSNFDFDWKIFETVSLLGGVEIGFPFKSLSRSITIIGGVETTFRLNK